MDAVTGEMMEKRRWRQWAERALRLAQMVRRAACLRWSMMR